jgi:outer membrane protein OmpA-like peptidoglycan-associated protein
MTEKNEFGQWKTPMNLGKPINSPADDISFHLFIDGVSGIFTSNREGSDDDIYFFHPKDSLSFLSKEVDFHRPIIHTIDIQHKDTSVIVTEKPKEEIKETPKEEQKIEDKKQEEIKEMPKPIALEKVNNLDSFFVQLNKIKSDYTFKIKEKTTFLLEKIHFDEKMELDSLSKNQLNLLKNLLDSFPVSIQILVHTAAKGKEKDNLERSKKQGLRIVKYLADKGINRERLRSKGMGETLPRCGKDCQDRFGLDEEQANERIEIKLK